MLLDPPYDVSETEVSAVLTGLLGSDLLDEDALIVVERSARSPEPTWPVGLVRTAQRSYGETALWYAERDLDG